MNNINIFVDDIRLPDFNLYYKSKDWKIIRSYTEFVKCVIIYDVPKLISFDHDLSEEKTGYDCVKWLCNYCLKNNYSLPDIKYHTCNPVGRENMIKYVENFLKHFPNLKQ